MSFLGGRFFGSRFLGGRFFGGAAEAAATTNANPQAGFAWPLYSDRSVTYTPTFSGGSWQATLPLANLADRHLARTARSANALTASTTFDVDLKTARNVGLLALPKHNLSASGSVRWRASATADFAVLLYDSGALTAWPSGASAEDLDGLNASHVHIPATAVSARYWRCLITDTGNPAGFVELSRLVIAGLWKPEGINVGARIGMESATDRIETDGGAALYRAKPIRRYWDFTLSLLEETEAFAVAWKMQRQLGQHGQLFFVFDIADPYMHERSFLCVLRELSPVEYPFAAYQSVAFRLLEEL